MLSSNRTKKNIPAPSQPLLAAFTENKPIIFKLISKLITIEKKRGGESRITYTDVYMSSIS